MDKVVLVTGTFNIIHAGHIELLYEARRLGNWLVVGLNGDDYQYQKYGELAVPLEHRIRVMAALKPVNEVRTFLEDNPSELIRQIRPNYFVRGPDYRNIALPEAHALEEVGCKLIVVGEEKIGSSSVLIQAIYSQ